MTSRRSVLGMLLVGLLTMGCAGAHKPEQQGGDAFWGTGDDPILSRCYSQERPGVNCDDMTETQRQDFVDNDGAAFDPELNNRNDDSERDDE